MQIAAINYKEQGERTLRVLDIGAGLLSMLPRKLTLKERFTHKRLGEAIVLYDAKESKCCCLWCWSFR